MKKFLFKGIIVFTVILLSALSAFTCEIDIFADNLEYDEQVGKLFAKGNAVFNWENRKVSADYIEFDKKTVKAFGNVKVEESGTIIYAESATYNYDEETGHIDETFGYSSSTFIQAKSIEMQNKDIYVIKAIKFSKCDLDNPHTHFRAKHGRLELNKRLTVYNAVFYIGKVPVFYLPIFTKSLKDDKSFGSDLKIEFNPKFENKSMYLNTVISCALSKSLKGKVFADFFRKQESSYGIKIDYLAENANGDININETNNFKKCEVTSDYLHVINSTWSMRWMARFKNNIDIELDNQKRNDKFNKQKRNNKLIDLSVLQGNHPPYDLNYDKSIDLSFLQGNYPSYNHNYYASVTRQGSDTNLNISFMYRSTDKPSTDKPTKRLNAVLPKAELASYSRKIFLGVIHNFYFMHQNVYRTLSKNKEPFCKNDSFFYYKLMRDFKFGNQFTLVPALKITVQHFNKDDFGEEKYGGFFIKYTYSSNARFRVTDWMDWNVNYAITNAITKTKSLGTKTLRNKKNSLSFNNNMYFGESVAVQNFFAYNLNKYLPLPFVTEIMWTLNSDMTVFIRQEQFIRQKQFLDTFKFNSLKLDLIIGNLEKVYLNFGTFYQRYDKFLNLYRNREIDNILGVGIWLTPKWKLDFNVKTTIPFDSISNSKINEYEFRLYRDLHCYNFSITWKKQADKESEFSLKLNAKTSTSSDKKATWNLDNDEIFHPWQ
ncbi:hypothetical protein [Candidatus Endomicrobiellum agilis]|uniref:hypothetical protein n=1 Tax=Candidatus Endomicrobiellum agilis TaxID=3238957 RepID=UPI0035740E2B|nr:hypothetical protein [Endomicrobium sp.]